MKYTFSTKLLNGLMSALLVVGSLSIALAAPKVEPSKELEKAKLEIQKLKKESDTAKSVEAKMKAELNKSKSSEAKLKEEHGKMNIELGKAKKEIGTLKSELAKAGVEKIKADLKNTQAELAKTKAELVKTKNELTKAKTDLIKATEEIEALEVKVNELQELNDYLKAHMDDLTSDHEGIVEDSVDYLEMGYEIELGEGELGEIDEVIELNQLSFNDEVIDLNIPGLVQLRGAEWTERHIWINKEIMGLLGIESELNQLDILNDEEFNQRFEYSWDDVDSILYVEEI